MVVPRRIVLQVDSICFLNNVHTFAYVWREVESLKSVYVMFKELAFSVFFTRQLHLLLLFSFAV